MPSQQSEPEQRSSRLNPVTLAIASASSVVAALVVSQVWGPGTIVGAAVTPVIITLVAELLTRPAEKIAVVKPAAAAARATPRASGRRPAPPPAKGEFAAVTVHRSRTRPRPLAIALVTGLLAFAIGAVVLTSTELVFGDRSVSSGDSRTTVFGGSRGSSKTTDTRTEPAPTTSTETRTETQTETTPAPTGPTPPATTPARPAPSTGVTPPTAPDGGAAPETGPTTP